MCGAPICTKLGGSLNMRGASEGPGKMCSEAHIVKGTGSWSSWPSYLLSRAQSILFCALHIAIGGDGGGIEFILTFHPSSNVFGAPSMCCSRALMSLP